ncbi:hypothetical protein TWF718_006180 [Orbilia javanica]|uniref:HNH nuclease domain-containing protein n=1 Tax=Orbilia javanica TaxID=47235 RepID=A0AAN8RK13_9PEZI
MASRVTSDSDENSELAPRVPNTKILPYVAGLFQDLKESDPNLKITSIAGFYQEYEEGPELLIGEDFSDKIRALVDTILKKYDVEIKAGQGIIGDGMDLMYNRYKLFDCILKEATPKGQRIFVFGMFLAIAIPTVFKVEGLIGLGDIVSAVEAYIRQMGQNLEAMWEGLNGLADSLVVQLIVPIYRTRGTYTPENASAFQDGDGCVIPGMTEERVAEYQDLTLEVLMRDNYTCVVTGKFDTLAETGTVSSSYRVAHIIPWGLDWDASLYKETRNRITWNLLDIFAANDSGRLSDSLSDTLDGFHNSMTLSRDVYRRFEGLELWLELKGETDTEYKYRIGGDTGGIFGPTRVSPEYSVVMRKGPRCPNPRLLILHAKLSRIATVSGAIYVAKEYTGKGAKAFIKYARGYKSVHPKALELKLISINEPENRDF